MCRITDNMKLVYNQAYKINLTPNARKLLDFDDLVGYGSLGLVKADKTFNDNKGYKFSTYACTCIRNEMLMALRQINKTPYIDSLDRPIAIDNNGEYTNLLQDTICSNDDVISDAIFNGDIKAIAKAITKLSAKQRYCLLHYYGVLGYEQLNQRQIANDIHLSQAQVSRNINKAVFLIRKEVEIKSNGGI